ncbi:olfactory receptor 4E2-like [Alligator sinensis]|uniref:Olfactory receptor n=1 Tax=Alligator sinensis TaxID=38654 RepID=A0A1U7SR57_ALLSI|nr:olfactory receptor 4E2-like [Alligator sinensis]QKE59395.1 olfactory receptor 4E2-like protein [Alligator sinensis]
MDGENGTTVTHFVLLGLTARRELQLLLFPLFLLMYLLVLAGNLLILVTVAGDRRLYTLPMYFFLGNLSFIDICHATVTGPKMLWDLLAAEKTISFGGCVAQLFFLHLSACAEIFLLTVMAYDRCIAICRPLQYPILMHHSRCAGLVGGLWVGATIHSLAQAALVLRLPYCGPNIIDNFFCDVPPIVKLACTDSYQTGVLIVSNSGTISLTCFLALLGSYLAILVSIWGRGAAGRSKALSTCAAHWAVVVLFFGPCIFIYTRPATSFSLDKVVSLFYTLVTPVLNPVIYTLRNQEIQGSMWKLWRRGIFSWGE